MTHDFAANRPYLEDEFAGAQWLDDTGLAPEALREGMWTIVRDHPELSMLRLRGRVFSYIEANARLAVNPHSLFCGKLDYGVHYGESAGQGVYSDLYYKTNGEILEKANPALWAKKQLAGRIGLGFGSADYWHTMPDWASLLRLGLPGLLARSEKAYARQRESGALTPEREDFYLSVRDHVGAGLDYIKRQRALAERFALTEWGGCLRALEEGAPKTLYQAMQLMIAYLELEEMGVERGRTLGRLDVLLAPFYEHDLAAGLTREDIKEYFRYFFMRFQAARRFAAQPFCIGGRTAGGANGSEELIRLMLEVYEELDIRNPKIQVRMHRDFPEDIVYTLLRLIRKGNSAIVFVNDEAVVRAYERVGVSREDALGYVIFGCYEPMLPGLEDAMIGASWTNMVKAVEFAMNGGREPATGEVFVLKTPETFETFEAFLDAVKAQIRAIIAFIREAIESEIPYTMRINPSPMYSATIESCVERGMDVFEPGSMKYHNLSIKCFGIGTLTDAVLAVKKFVFERGEVSFEALREAVNGNWEGAELLRRRIQNDSCKYGNACGEADELARDLYKTAAAEIVGRETGFGGRYRMGGDSITNCIYYAQPMGATPDGRKAGEPVSKNFSPALGMDRKGVTALLKSAATIDGDDFCDAAAVDLVLHSSAVEGEEGLNAMRGLLAFAMRNGIFALQGNVLNKAELLDAQEHPEKYPRLQVRLCGWNEYWVNMDKVKQDSFLKRL